MKKLSTQQILKNEMENYIKEFQPRVKDILEKATLSLLGLEKRGYSEFEIDHCNGRNSVLIDAFKKMAEAEATKIASTYKPTKEDIVNFKSAFEREYKNQMSYAIRDIVKEKVREDITKEMEKISINVNDILLDIFKKDDIT